MRTVASRPVPIGVRRRSDTIFRLYMSKILKIGLIGTGGIARSCHIPGYQSIPDQCEIIWACDVDEALATKVAAEHGIPKVTANYHDVLDDPTVDAVSITTPNKYHYKPTMDAFAAGKHVLCEKPLAMNGVEARQMCRAARDAGKILQVGLHLRFGGNARFLRDYIDAGHMGDIYYARAQALRRRGVPAWGVFIDKEQQGGGPLIDIGVHILDFTLFLMGYPKPVSVSGKTFDALGKNPDLFNFWGDYDRKQFTVEDFAVAFVRFDNGAVITLESSFMANHDKNEEWKTQIYGTKAGASCSPWGSDVSISLEQDKQLFTLKPDNLPEVQSAHTAEIQAFVQAIQLGKPSPVPGEHGLILNAIFDAIYRSSESGKEQQVDVTF